jgi:hypothetical protein
VGSFLFALLVALTAVAVPYYSRLQTRTTGRYPTAFVAVIERPG